jgi:hypothetical protein
VRGAAHHALLAGENPRDGAIVQTGLAPQVHFALFRGRRYEAGRANTCT